MSSETISVRRLTSSVDTYAIKILSLNLPLPVRLVCMLISVSGLSPLCGRPTPRHYLIAACLAFLNLGLMLLIFCWIVLEKDCKYIKKIFNQIPDEFGRMPEIFPSSGYHSGWLNDELECKLNDLVECGKSELKDFVKNSFRVGVRVESQYLRPLEININVLPLEVSAMRLTVAKTRFMQHQTDTFVELGYKWA